MSPQRALIIFCKTVVLGKVKTRLATTVGNEQAAQIYASLLAHTRAEARKVKAEHYAFLTPEPEPWEGFTVFSQAGDDLGDRMANALAKALEKNDKAVLIGGDIAQINAAIIEDAFAKLDHVDVVLGPAEDGGYYLIGMKDPHRAIFENMVWSQSNVAEETRKRIHTAELTHTELSILSDIDYWEDWQKYGWNLPGIDRS